MTRANHAAPSPAETPPALGDLPAFVAGVLRDWHAPGLAVAVAREGALVLLAGYGLRDVARGLPVTPQTRFAIGSCTKAFTTMSLALLADDGALDWDAPVTEYLPTFAMHDPFASARITPRDLVTHRSGLPRHDLSWYGAAATRAEIVARIRHLEPNRDFRTTWQYQNLMYLSAGYLAGQLAGQTWEDLVQARLFDRLGMVGANFSVARSQETGDFARPYQEKEGEAREMPFRTIDEVGPAGSINASMADMGRWLLLHLNRGEHDGERVVSAGQMDEMHAPQMVIPSTGKYPEVVLPSYGLGWFVESYRGRTVVHHGGNIDGFSALTTFMPREKIGAVVLANLDGAPVPNIVAYGVYDRLLALDPVPWNDRWLKERDEQKAAGETGKAKRAAERVPDTAPSHPLDAYVGDFAHPGYGTLAVARDDDGLTLRYNALVGPLVHHHYDSFAFTFEAFDLRVLVTFAADPAGDIGSVAAPLEPTTPDIVFVRVPPAAMTDPAFLDRFVGAYEVMGATMTVARSGTDALLLSLPGQPAYALEPRRGTEFRLAGLSGFSVEFKADASGAVTEAILTQPDGAYTARRTG